MKRIVMLLCILSLLLTGCEMYRGQVTEPSATEQNEEQGTPILDNNGNKIGTVKFQLGENGEVLTEELFFDDGTFIVREYEYGTDGKKIKCKYIDSSGSKGEETYYDNGKLQSKTSERQDGTFSISNYRDNGNLDTTSISYADGSKVAHVYYEHGKLQSSTITCANGTVIESLYYESGGLQTISAKDDLLSIEYHYNEDGTPVDGQDRRDKNNPGWFGTVELEGDKPGVQKKYYDDMGYLRHYVNEYENGSKFGEAYYESGVMKGIHIEDAYEKCAWSFYDNGTIQDYKRISDTMNYSAFFLPNNMFGDQRIVDYEKQVLKEFTYDIYGVIIDSSEMNLS